MKKSLIRRTFLLILSAVFLMPSMAPPAGADDTYYVNGSGTRLETPLDETWAIGEGGTALLSGTPVSVMTASGLTTLGDVDNTVVDSDPAQKGLNVTELIEKQSLHAYILSHKSQASD